MQSERRVRIQIEKLYYNMLDFFLFVASGVERQSDPAKGA